MKDLEGFKLPAQTAPKPRTRTLVDSLVTVQETGRAGFTGVQERLENVLDVEILSIKKESQDEG